MRGTNVLRAVTVMLRFNSGRSISYDLIKQPSFSANAHLRRHHKSQRSQPDAEAEHKEAENHERWYSTPTEVERKRDSQQGDRARDGARQEKRPPSQSARQKNVEISVVGKGGETLTPSAKGPTTISQKPSVETPTSIKMFWTGGRWRDEKIMMSPK